MHVSRTAVSAVPSDPRNQRLKANVATDVSIVVVHWNVPALLRECLASIERERERTALDIETIVVDMASPERTFRDVLKGFPGVRYLEMDQNRGYAAGCNGGIRQVSGEAVLLLNADVELLTGAIDKLWEALHVSTHIGMVAPLLLNADGSIQSAGYRFPGVMNVVCDLLPVPVPGRIVESPLNGRVPVGDGVQPIKVDYALGAAMMARRSAIDDVGLLDESYVMYSEEIDWAKRFAEGGWTALLVPLARIVHHGGGSTSQRPDAMHEALWGSRARYLERWGTARQRRWSAVAVKLGTHLSDRGATTERRASNARIRERFARLGSRDA
jgi:N-acetylglucosaminyl-diphospho-decaprenol L-rhamnosyltransferase